GRAAQHPLHAGAGRTRNHPGAAGSERVWHARRGAGALPKVLRGTVVETDGGGRLRNGTHPAFQPRDAAGMVVEWARAEAQIVRTPAITRVRLAGAVDTQGGRATAVDGGVGDRNRASS